MVSTHSRPKAAGGVVNWGSFEIAVSTHSRPKAAGEIALPRVFADVGFNTQPPEGGWAARK